MKNDCKDGSRKKRVVSFILKKKKEKMGKEVDTITEAETEMETETEITKRRRGQKRHNVVALISGGKDSLLSVCWCRALGHEVVAVANLVPGWEGREEEDKEGGGGGGYGDVRRGGRKGGRVGDEDEDEGTVAVGDKRDSDNVDSDDVDSYMYQTVGHALVPLIAEALGVVLYQGEIWISGGAGADNAMRDRSGGDDDGCVRLATTATITAEGSGRAVGVDLPLDAEALDAETLDAETLSLYNLLKRVLAIHPDVTAIASGAIYSTYQRVRIEKVATRLGLVSLAWLWEGPGILEVDGEDAGVSGGEEGFIDVVDEATRAAAAAAAAATTAAAVGKTGRLIAGRGRVGRKTGARRSRTGSRRLLDSLAAVGLEARVVKVASGGLDERSLWLDLRDGAVRDDLERRLGLFERMGYGYGGGGGGGGNNDTDDDDDDDGRPSAAILGEGGEFETLVLDGPWPVFRKRIMVPEEKVRVVPGSCGSASVRIDLGMCGEGQKGEECVRLVDKEGSGGGEYEDVDAWTRNLARPPLLSSLFGKMLERVQKRNLTGWDGIGKSPQRDQGREREEMREDGKGEKGLNETETKHVLRSAPWSVEKVGSLLFVGNMLVEREEGCKFNKHVGGSDVSERENGDDKSGSSPTSTATAAIQLQHILTRLVETLESLTLTNIEDYSKENSNTRISTPYNKFRLRSGSHIPPSSFPYSLSARSVLASVLQTTILLRTLSPSIFADINAVYARFFTFDGPPARVTVSCGSGESLLPDDVNVVMSAVVDLRVLRSSTGRMEGDSGIAGVSSRVALHVQSQSFWAPANIGPYSQGVAMGLEEEGEGEAAAAAARIPEKIVFLSGQIPLVPATMDVVRWEDIDTDLSNKCFVNLEDQVNGLDDFPLQTVLSLQHLYRVSRAMKARSWFGGIAFISTKNTTGECGSEAANRRARITSECWKRAYVMSRRGKRVMKGERKRRYGYKAESRVLNNFSGSHNNDDSSEASSDFSGGDIDPWDRMYGYGRFKNEAEGLEGLSRSMRVGGTVGLGGEASEKRQNDAAEDFEAVESTHKSDADTTSDSDDEDQLISDSTGKHCPPCFTIQMSALPRDVDVEWTGVGYTGYTNCSDDSNITDGAELEIRVEARSMYTRKPNDQKINDDHCRGNSHTSTYGYTYVPLRHHEDMSRFLKGRNGASCAGGRMTEGEAGNPQRKSKNADSQLDAGHVTVYATPALVRYLSALHTSDPGVSLCLPDQVVPCYGVWDRDGVERLLGLAVVFSSYVSSSVSFA